MLNILLLGSSGFVGKNLSEALCDKYGINNTQRIDPTNNTIVYFDLEKKDTWANLLTINFDVIINSIGYGVVKAENDLNKLFQINYILPMQLREYLIKQKPDLFWIQIGTAFEYSLTNEEILENSETNPLTFYGISKLMMSNYLISSSNDNFLILRPFAMFGKYEEKTKIIPALINAQKEKRIIDLSSGTQERDYFFVEDLTRFLDKLLEKDVNEYKRELINVGSRIPRNLLEIADQLASKCPDYSEELWNWGKLPQREGESKRFYNASSKCFEFGFELTPLDIALNNTINHYWKNK